MFVQFARTGVGQRWDGARRSHRAGRFATTAAVVGLVATSVATTGAQASARTAPAQASVSSYLQVDPYTGIGPHLGASLNVFSPNYVGLGDAVLLPLAIPKPPKYTGSYYPQLATSWSIKGSTVTIHLRKNAVWQGGGGRVTSADYSRTLLLDGVGGQSPIWSDITGYATPNPTTITLHVRPGIAPTLALYYALTIDTVPKAAYQKYVVPGLAKDLEAAATSPTSSAGVAASKVISAVQKKLEDASFTTFQGDGPFQFSKMTSNEVVLQKSPSFWGAKKVHVPGITVIGPTTGTNQAVWAEFSGGRLDYATVGATYQAVQSMSRVPGARVYEPNATGFMFAIFFDDHKAPFKNANVRRAFAYIIDRPKLSGLVDAHSPDHLYPQTPIPTGDPANVYKNYLTPAQIKKLNPYKPNPAKAASLLKSAGLKKRGSKWYLPNGKPFKFTLYTIEGENDTTSVALSAANQLSNFGIQAKVTSVDPTTDVTYLEKGTFTTLTLYPSGALPLQTINEVLAGWNYSPTGRGIGLGPVENVPGLGKVNIPKTVAKEWATVSPTSKKMKNLMNIWMRYVNDQIPFLAVTSRNVLVEVVNSKSRYSDWPPAKSPLWAISGAEPAAAIPLMAERGYIRPASGG